MRRQSRAEPKRPYLVAADALVPQPQLDHVREQLRNRSRPRRARPAAPRTPPAPRGRSGTPPLLPSVDLHQHAATRRSARARRRPPPGRCNCVSRLCALLGRAGGRQATGLPRPPLDAAPAPDRGPAELAERLREARVRSRARLLAAARSRALRDVDRDHELGSRINLHVGNRSCGPLICNHLQRSPHPIRVEAVVGDLLAVERVRPGEARRIARLAEQALRERLQTLARSPLDRAGRATRLSDAVLPTISEEALALALDDVRQGDGGRTQATGRCVPGPTLPFRSLLMRSGREHIRPVALQPRSARRVPSAGLRTDALREEVPH